MPIIGCGGIFDIGSAREKIEAGAKLLQVYTGFIYRGPNLIRELATL
jgi:dihydroorotate dehydrogenase